MLVFLLSFKIFIKYFCCLFIFIYRTFVENAASNVVRVICAQEQNAFLRPHQQNNEFEVKNMRTYAKEAKAVHFIVVLPIVIKSI